MTHRPEKGVVRSRDLFKFWEITDNILNKKLSYRRETRATLCISWNAVLLLYKQAHHLLAYAALSATTTFYSACQHVVLGS